MTQLRELLLDNEDWLMQRILEYVTGRDYAKYTSTLLEAWRLSISGLNQALLLGMEALDGQAPEFAADADFTQDPIAAFGVAEARLHRQRGISLALFMGLLKYYRQTYQDLVREKIDDPRHSDRYEHFIVRCFDLIELALCSEWNQVPRDELIQELQSANRALSNEKNRLAAIDPLTGAHNRRSFLEQAESEWERSRRYEHPLSVLMIDIDHFKLINDTYGHDIGDVTLQVLTRACMKILRENDVFGRLGGEEFAALLVETDEDRALQVAERLRREIAELRVSHADLSFFVQISIGAATLLENDDRVEIMLKKADQALYKAKCLGRNRVVAASQLALLP